MRYGVRRTKKVLRCAICHVAVGFLHDTICPRRDRTPMTVDYNDTHKDGVSEAELASYQKKGGI